MTGIFRWGQITKEKLREIIAAHPEYIGKGLSILDENLGTDEEGMIDLLAADPSGRLVVINIDVRENDDLIIRSLSQVQWIATYQGMLKRMYAQDRISFDRPPLLLILSPSFSRRAKAAARQITNQDIQFMTYSYILIGSGDAITFDEAFSNRRSVQKKTTASEDARASEQVRLTPEELAGLMSMPQAITKKKK